VSVRISQSGVLREVVRVLAAARSRSAAMWAPT
jgi:hypothetical protein